MKYKDLRYFTSIHEWKINKKDLKKVKKYKLPAILIFLKLGYTLKRCIELSEYAVDLSKYTIYTIEESSYNIGRSIESFNAGIEIGKRLNND